MSLNHVLNNSPLPCRPWKQSERVDQGLVTFFLLTHFIDTFKEDDNDNPIGGHQK